MHFTNVHNNSTFKFKCHSETEANEMLACSFKYTHKEVTGLFSTLIIFLFTGL